MKKKSYNHRLSIVTLFHMPLVVCKRYNFLLLCSPYIWPESQCNSINFLPLNHKGDEPGFIGLGRIGMVEKMVGEVEGRSYYGGISSPGSPEE